MSQISAVIITYNEEKLIGRCLESLHGIADEIVVVDSFSTDKTVEICTRPGVRLVKHSFEGYIEQKNWALQQASNKWVLSIDADEEVSKELRNSILEVKDNLNCDGYYLNRRNCYCGTWIKFSGLYPEKHLRLFNSGKGRWAGLNPHDKFVPDRGTTILRLHGDLLHQYCNSYDDHREKMKTFSSIASQSYLAAGRKAGMLTAPVHAGWSFIRSFILRGGFLDGYAGYKICSICAWGTWLKYRKLSILLKEKKAGGVDV